jgi:hypothetical protein
MCVEGIRLDQHTLKLQLAKAFLELGVLVALVGGVVALRNYQAQCWRAKCFRSRRLSHLLRIPNTATNSRNQARNLMPWHMRASGIAYSSGEACG